MCVRALIFEGVVVTHPGHTRLHLCKETVHPSLKMHPEPWDMRVVDRRHWAHELGYCVKRECGGSRYLLRAIMQHMHVENVCELTCMHPCHIYAIRLRIINQNISEVEQF